MPAKPLLIHRFRLYFQNQLSQDLHISCFRNAFK
jgi:hypothetical protein